VNISQPNLRSEKFDNNNEKKKLCHKCVKFLKLKTIKINIRVNPRAAESELRPG